MSTQQLISVFKCQGINEKEDRCRLGFLREHPEFEYISISDKSTCTFNSHCIFKAISEFYRRSGMTVPGITHPDQYEELRRYVVEQFERYISNHPNTQIKLFEYIPTILNINLSIYMREPSFKIYPFNRGPLQYVISNYMLTPHNGPKANATISVFISDRYYDLLYSIKDPINTNINLAASMHKLSLNNKGTKRKKVSNKRINMIAISTLSPNIIGTNIKYNNNIPTKRKKIGGIHIKRSQKASKKLHKK